MLALSRNYNADYLAEIGQAGTGGCMVARGGAPLSRARFTAEAGLPASALSLALPVPAWIYYPDTYWNSVQHEFRLDVGYADRLSSWAYANGDGSVPQRFWHGSLGVGGSSGDWSFELSGFGDTFRWKASAVVSLLVLEILYPWWGSHGSGVVHVAPEGHWAMRYEADLFVSAEWLEGTAFIRYFEATASGWFHSVDPFHRIRGARRAFAHAGDPAPEWRRWPVRDSAAAEVFADWYDEGQKACALALGNFLSSAQPYLQVVSAQDW